MKTIRAIYANGVLRPTEPMDPPENSVVEFEPRPVEPAKADLSDTEGLDAVYEILSRRFPGGRHDLAARHDEHQPRRRPSSTPSG